MDSGIRMFVSGVNSDPDPSPGVGIARALRAAFGDMHVTAVDYSTRSSGIHHECFDDAWVQPVWSELELGTYARTIRDAISEDGTCWISGLDAEVDWLCNAVGDHPRLLIPNRTAQEAIRKPECKAAASLGMRVPQWLPATADPPQIHRLGRHAGWRLWVKGKYHEAYTARQYNEVGRQIEALRHHWPLEDIFVQQHIGGLERAFAFAAYRGQLLGAVEVEKRAVTSQGKTWAAAVRDVDATVLRRLEAFVKHVTWTGGGEVEFVRARSGDEWLIDLNPRFPAYIYGPALCGHNLPARLVAAAMGIPSPPEQPRRRQFIRVVHEIPVRDDLQLPPLVGDHLRNSDIGKHPSFQPQLVRRMVGQRASDASNVQRPERQVEAAPVHSPVPYIDVPTPARVRDWSSIRSLLHATCQAIDILPAEPRVVPALSIKTDPCHDLGAAAVEMGWWAEAISVQEVEWAIELGFPKAHIVFNGPAASALRASAKGPIAAAFADSVEAIEDVLFAGVCHTPGLRLRLPSTTSRFGIDVGDHRIFLEATRLLASSASRPYGLHFHVAADVCGPSRWFELVEESLAWAHAISSAVGHPPSVVDLGGGWHSEDFTEAFLPSLGKLQHLIRSTLPGVGTVILEPGKAVAAPTASLVCEVTEVRAMQGDRRVDVVVDAALADLPMAALYAHSVTVYRGGHAVGCLSGGTGRVLGRSCMETDVLADRVSFPVLPQVGDRLLFSGAGGYNASMAYRFGRGSNGEARLQ